ncbi:MAG TPA: 3-hydroxyacyl-CoA dehydrogenase family protein [Micromonosporaceae bacterium]|nr:3-hydroxyacyl-CoA dehydrogenase family protein [Micromonosporaceae bacterium]
MTEGHDVRLPNPSGAGRVAVIGAGTMGAGLAQIAAMAGREVVLYSRTEATLTSALASVDSSLRRLAARSEATAAPIEPARVRQRITPTTDLGDIDGVAVLIESVAEDLTTKQKIFAEVAERCTDDALLATNTSGIPIGRIAAATPCPERVVGMHFFAPVPIMQLCEIVRGESTSDSTVAAARDFATEIGKRSIVVERDTPGFITTRLLTVLILEAIRMVENGICSATDVDLACQLGFGHPMGPLAMVDLSGLDVFHDVATNLHQATGNPLFESPSLLQQLVAAGQVGRKSGRGFHHYPDTDRIRPEDHP